MKLAIALTAALALAGCMTDQGPPVQTFVSGPVFAAKRFECPREHPAPPDPKTVAADQVDRAAAVYETRLDAWGRSCRDQLRSLNGELEHAGQVKK